MKKVYVGNLPFSVTNDQLRNYFEKAGKVIEAVVIMDKYSGKNKGFGFVEYENEKDAEEAIKMFNRKNFEGRDLVVNEARPKAE